MFGSTSKGCVPMSITQCASLSGWFGNSCMARLSMVPGHGSWFSLMEKMPRMSAQSIKLFLWGACCLVCAYRYSQCLVVGGLNEMIVYL